MHLANQLPRELKKKRGLPAPAVTNQNCETIQYEDLCDLVAIGDLIRLRFTENFLCRDVLDANCLATD